MEARKFHKLILFRLIERRRVVPLYLFSASRTWLWNIICNCQIGWTRRHMQIFFPLLYDFPVSTFHLKTALFVSQWRTFQRFANISVNYTSECQGFDNEMLINRRYICFISYLKFLCVLLYEILDCRSNYRFGLRTHMMTTCNI